MKKLIVCVIIISIGSLFIGCGKQKIPNAPIEKNVNKSSLENNKVINSEGFIKFMKKSGYKITNSKQVSGGILKGSLTAVEINNERIGIYEYKSSDEMEMDAKTISADGTFVGNGIYEWIAKPHFYKGGNIIISYIGDDKEIIEKISKFMGQQFAGA